MWSKISSALKPARPGTPAIEDDEQSSPVSTVSILSKVYEQHPNLSVFHNNTDEVPFPTPSPPASPSKHSRMGVFKRLPKAPWSENNEIVSSSPRLLPLSIPKKVKSNFLTSNGTSLPICVTICAHWMQVRKHHLTDNPQRPLKNPMICLAPRRRVRGHRIHPLPRPNSAPSAPS